MKHKCLAVAFAIIILLMMATTFFLYLKKNDSPQSPSPVAVEVPVTVATTTATTTQESTFVPPKTDMTVEELTKDKGELIEVKRLGNGVTQEVRKEIAIQRWTHPSGVVATLYRNDEFYDTDGTENNSFALKVVNKDGQEHTLYSFEPDLERLVASRSDISAVEVSPLGTYLMAYTSGYESSWVRFYDLRNGGEVVKKDEYGNFLLRGASPYWNADESKLLLLSNSDSMGGCMDCGTIKFSRTGGFDDIKTILDVGDRSVHFGDVVLEGSTATFVVTERTFGTAEEGNKEIKSTATFDLSTGTLHSGLSI